jgi:hypothetical protein
MKIGNWYKLEMHSKKILYLIKVTDHCDKCKQFIAKLYEGSAIISDNFKIDDNSLAISVWDYIEESEALSEIL